MNDNQSQVRRRALAHIESLSLWINPTIVKDLPPDAVVLSRHDAVDPTQYREIHIELYLPEETLNEAVAANSSTPDEAKDVERFLTGPWEVVITCSATDVVDVDWPGVS